MAISMTHDEKQRFHAFVRDLELISAKHGVLIQVTGNVHVQDASLDAVRYTDDWSSGDIHPIEYKRQNMVAPRRWGYEQNMAQMRKAQMNCRLHNEHRYNRDGRCMWCDAEEPRHI